MDEPEAEPGLGSLRNSWDGIYHRMEDADRSQRFKNKMRLTIRGSTAVFAKLKREPIELSIEWSPASPALGGPRCLLDWTPVSADWGRAVFRRGSVDGKEGLIERPTVTRVFVCFLYIYGYRFLSVFQVSARYYWF
jgi:hypothetical protein